MIGNQLSKMLPKLVIEKSKLLGFKLQWLVFWEGATTTKNRALGVIWYTNVPFEPLVLS